tara:strand:- start:1282 stop:1896 length:615 start_codon:yes stop_codon:yes gene_type:complete
MKVYEYESYEQYVEKQTMANKAKIDRAWIVKSTVAAIKNWYVREYDKLPTKILCHGTRNGAEQKLFKSLIGNDVEVLGTEISETAIDFPDTVQWDFTDQNVDWVGYWDIVYSNSFDHSPTPTKTICAWRDQLNDGGVLVLDHSSWNEFNNTKPNSVDCLDISFKELEELINDNGMRIITRKPFRSANDRPNSTYESWFYFIKKG